MKQLLNYSLIMFSCILLSGCATGVVKMYEEGGLSEDKVVTLIPKGVQITSVNGTLVRPPRGVRLRNTHIQLKPGEYFISILLDDGSQFTRNISESIKVKARFTAGQQYTVTPLYLENFLWCPLIKSKDENSSNVIVPDNLENVCITYNPEGAKGFDLLVSTNAFCLMQAKQMGGSDGGEICRLIRDYLRSKEDKEEK